MDELDTLVEVLEASIRKNGDKTLTLSHLLNILRFTQRKRDNDEFIVDLQGIRADTND